MTEKEERILIARSTDYTLSNTDKGELFEGKIAPHCANVYTRQQAIEVMAKGMNIRLTEKVKNNEKGEISFEFYAEAALNALLEGGKK